MYMPAVLESVIGPLSNLVSEEQLDPVDDILCFAQPAVAPPAAVTGSQPHAWQEATAEQWQAFALQQQGWDLQAAYQMAYCSQHGDDAQAMMAHMQVSTCVREAVLQLAALC